MVLGGISDLRLYADLVLVVLLSISEGAVVFAIWGLLLLSWLGLRCDVVNFFIAFYVLILYFEVIWYWICRDLDMLGAPGPMRIILSMLVL